MYIICQIIKSLCVFQSSMKSRLAIWIFYMTCSQLFIYYGIQMRRAPLQQYHHPTIKTFAPMFVVQIYVDTGCRSRHLDHLYIFTYHCPHMPYTTMEISPVFIPTLQSMAAEKIKQPHWSLMVLLLDSLFHAECRLTNKFSKPNTGK